MQVNRVVTGEIEENCYLVWEDDQLLIIDPGADSPRIIEEINKTEAKPLAILLTHAHFDHIGAVDTLRDFYHIEVYLSPLEKDWLQDPSLNLSASFEESIIVRPAEKELENKEYQLGNLSFKVVSTPGHSIGSVSFIFENFVIAGDTLFRGSIGRSDLPTGNLEQLLESIQSQLFTLPNQFPVYPGHGAPTTIEVEKRSNPFFVK
ncbi:MAG TPA: MBL fold metallo-hydrolase [Candidatus Tetragenococcus pullicola]|nr:MBL fold metallo-hydrolase [Candidatus Tetragenococcus pullicola]